MIGGAERPADAVPAPHACTFRVILHIPFDSTLPAALHLRGAHDPRCRDHDASKASSVAVEKVVAQLMQEG